MYSNTTGTSSLETECLYGEMVEIFDEYLDWVFCRLIVADLIPTKVISAK